MFKLDRLSALCDGVIAIAITLLVLGLEVPSAHEVPEKLLPEYLAERIYPLIGFVSSFALIGMFWLQHYLIFHFLTHANRVFVFLNLVFLLLVSFVPFPTGLHAVYRDDEMASVIYGGTVTLAGFTLLAIWLYAAHDRRLLGPNASPRIVKAMTWQILTTPIVSLTATAISFASISVGRALFLLIPIVYLTNRGVDETRLTPRERGAADDG